MSNELLKIKKFCQSHNKKDFDLLNLKTKSIFIKFSQIAIYSTIKDKTLAFDILKFVNTKPEKLKPQERSKAEKLLSSFDIALTGARVNDTLIGIKPVSKKAIIKIHKTDVLTQNRDLNVLRLYPDLWDKYLDRLGSIPFFSQMSKLERQLYVSLNTDYKENSIGEDLGDKKGTRFEILQVGNSDFVKKLSEEQLSSLMSNKLLKASDLYETFPRKPGSKAKRNTLIALKSFWTLNIDYQIMDKFDGTIINISTSSDNEIIVLEGLPLKYKKSVNSSQYVRSTTQKVGFKVNKSRIILNNLDMIKLAKDLKLLDNKEESKKKEEQIKYLYDLLLFLTAGQLKSLHTKNNKI